MASAPRNLGSLFRGFRHTRSSSSSSSSSSSHRLRSRQAAKEGQWGHGGDIQVSKAQPSLIPIPPSTAQPSSFDVSVQVTLFFFFSFSSKYIYNKSATGAERLLDSTDRRTIRSRRFTAKREEGDVLGRVRLPPRNPQPFPLLNHLLPSLQSRIFAPNQVNTHKTDLRLLQVLQLLSQLRRALGEGGSRGAAGETEEGHL